MKLTCLNSIKSMEIEVKIKFDDDEKTEVSQSHRHAFYAVFWIHEGSGKHYIDFCDYEIKKDRIFFLRPEQVHLLDVENQKINYSSILFSEDFFLLFEKNNDKEIPVFIDLICNDDYLFFSNLWQQLLSETKTDKTFKINILQGEIYMLLYRFLRIADCNKTTPQLPDIIEKYQKLINLNYRKKHFVSDYAQMLGVNSNYLNVLTQKHLNCKASDLISNRIVLEIKRKLIDTTLTVSEICYMLGFDEISYFSRYFKRLTGERPIIFRNRMKKMYK